MEFTKEALQTINNAFTENRNEKGIKSKGLGLKLDNSLGGAGIFLENWHIIDLKNIEQLIDELEIMRETIKQETGILF